MRPRWPWSTIALSAALVAVLADLWLAPSNMRQVFALEGQLAGQRTANRAAAERNLRTAAELADLREGLEMVEEKARRELGMVRADEILVQVSAQGTASSAALGERRASPPSSAPRAAGP